MNKEKQSAVSDQLSEDYQEEIELAELALQLMNKYSKPSMAMALALLIERVPMLRIGEIVENILKTSPKLKKESLESLIKLKAED